MRPPALIIGYHGCDKSVGEGILASGRKLRKSENDYDWLGHGVYFWENDPARAFQWAKAQQKRGKIATPYVIGALLAPKNCLDLTEQDSLDKIDEAYRQYAMLMAIAGEPLPENSPLHARPGVSDGDLLIRKLDCAVINALHVFRENEGGVPFDAVRGPFWEGEALYPGARIQRKSHIQIAVRDESVVLGYFLPTTT